MGHLVLHVLFGYKHKLFAGLCGEVAHTLSSSEQMAEGGIAGSSGADGLNVNTNVSGSFHLHLANVVCLLGIGIRHFQREALATALYLEHRLALGHIGGTQTELQLAGEGGVKINGHLVRHLLLV